MGLLERAERVRQRRPPARVRSGAHRGPLSEPSSPRGVSETSAPVSGSPASGRPHRVTTLLDRIYEAVEEKSEMSLRDIAATFHITLSQAEQWARVLDQRGMLELSSTIRTPVLRVRAACRPSHRLPRRVLLIAAASILVLLAVVALLRFT